MRAITIQPGIVANRRAYSTPAPKWSFAAEPAPNASSTIAKVAARAMMSASRSMRRMSQPLRRDREEARRCSRMSSVRWFANTVLGALLAGASAYELSKLISAMLSPLPPAVAPAEAAHGDAHLGLSLPLRLGVTGSFLKTRVRPES